MPAYVIVDVEVTDPDQYEVYKKLTPASLVAYGGKFIVRGGQVETLEGGWNPGRIVVLEFPSYDNARQWYDSTEYVQARAVRRDAAQARIIVADGFPG
jgi:uncharacterized protein (DUF1330 family)